ncbi:MAG TPA: FtsX-like permease family protein [Acidimicrobiales bacterium]|nr:FtsX-like permease family protein [Acidimicrobiales bacterium]
MAAGLRPRAARRAVLRWAWRLFRREWHQQVAVLALMTVSVAAAVAGATLAVTASSASQGEFGDAPSMARLDAATPGSAQATIADARRRWGSVEVIAHTSMAVPGSVVPLEVRRQDPAGSFGRPLLSLRSGRYPAAPNEVALTDGAAELLSVGIGGRVVLGDVQRTVVGRVENPSDLRGDFALLSPDEGAPADSWTLLFDADRRPVSAVREDGTRGGPNIGIMQRGDAGPVGALLLVAMTVSMALVGLIAASAFIVVAHRRQRQLGMLAALGAAGRHLRLVMLVNGALVGAVAATIGSALGMLGWVLAAPAAERAANHRLDRLDLPWSLIVAGGLLAVAAGAAAAWWPARSVARLPVMTALSGRPSQPLPVHRSLAAALVLLSLGMGGIVAALPTPEHARPLLLVTGMVAVLIGVVLAAPAAIRAMAFPARRLPVAARLALRDLVRHQARAAAALASITLGLGIAVSVVVLAQASEYRSDEGNLSDRQLVIRLGDARSAPDPDLGAPELDALDARALTVAAALGTTTLLPLDIAVPAKKVTDANHEPVTVAKPTGPASWRFVSTPYVATPELLRQLHVDRGTIGDEIDLLTVHGGVSLLDFTERPEPADAGAVRRIDGPAYTSAPSSLITERAMRRHGWVAARSGWFVDSDRRLTSSEIAAARSAAAGVGLAIETRSAQDELATLRSVATTAGALLALAIVAVTIGLLRNEGTRDRLTLTATGAGGRTRRALTATTAAALAVLGVVLGTGGAYAALVAGYHAQLRKLIPLPTAQLLALAAGLPMAASVTGWLLAGREPRTFSRQALD